MKRVLVIGAGVAGLSSALMLNEAGYNVTVVSRGMGGLLLSNGTVDVLGWPKGVESKEPVVDLAAGLESFIADNPTHPYATIGAASTLAGVSWFSKHLTHFESVETDAVRENKLLPTAVGALRPTALVPESMRNSVLQDGQKLLVVGLKRLKDFPAELIADNLSRSPYVNVTARAVHLDLPIRGGKEHDASATTHARDFDSHVDELVTELITKLKGVVEAGETILFPAVLGLRVDALSKIERELGAKLGEVPLPPPSVAGRRLNDELTEQCKAARIDIQLNAIATGYVAEGKKISKVKVQRAGRTTEVKVDFVVHAGGGFESGNLTRDSYYEIRESVFDLPLYSPEVSGKDFSAEKIFRTGVKVNSKMQAVDNAGEVVFENLHCAGSILGGALPWDEKSGEGIALGSAWALTEAIKMEAN